MAGNSTTCYQHGTHQLEQKGDPNSSQMGQLSSSGSGNRSGSAVAVRQGALQLRDLHEDAKGPGQGEGGVRGFPCKTQS